MTDEAKLEQIRSLKANASLLHSKDTIEAALGRLKSQLVEDYYDKDPVFLVVMNGGLIFAGKLLPSLDFPAQIDYCHATRYRGKTTGSNIEWKIKPQLNLRNRHVIIVDDILDEGYTLQAIIGACDELGALSISTLVLIEKLHNRKAVPNMTADYCELQTPDQYVFGYGMDCNHYWRNCEEIYLLNEE